MRAQKLYEIANETRSELLRSNQTKRFIITTEYVDMAQIAPRSCDVRAGMAVVVRDETNRLVGLAGESIFYAPRLGSLIGRIADKIAEA